MYTVMEGLLPIIISTPTYSAQSIYSLKWNIFRIYLYRTSITLVIEFSISEFMLLRANLLPWGRTEGQTKGLEVQQLLIMHVQILQKLYTAGNGR